MVQNFFLKKICQGLFNAFYLIVFGSLVVTLICEENLSIFIIFQALEATCQAFDNFLSCLTIVYKIYQDLSLSPRNFLDSVCLEYVIFTVVPGKQHSFPCCPGGFFLPWQLYVCECLEHGDFSLYGLQTCSMVLCLELIKHV